MSEYQLTDSIDVIRVSDGARIPGDPANMDRVEYEQWLDDGGVPLPYVPPEQPKPTLPEADPDTLTLYDHENRLLAIEGKPPMALGDFLRNTNRV